MTASRAVRASALAALVLAAAWLFWPIQAGGGTVYVVTHGISMEPRFHTGDLAILRAADSYAVGDVVAYRSVSLQTVVMHRIVDMDGERFVIQGDNNSWLDPDHPSRDLVLGKLWLRVPQGGKALAAVRSPAALGVVGLLGTGVIGTTTAVRGRRGRRRRPTAERSFSTSTRAMAGQVVLGSAAVALLAGVGAGVLLALPSTQTETTALPVSQHGRYTYSAAAVVGTTYPTGRVTTGDPIYTKLTRGLQVTLKDTFSGADLAGVQGSLRLRVSVAAPDGWTAALGAGAAVPFRQGSATASVALYPETATELLARHYAEVGGDAGGASLVVTPAVTVTGTASGRPFVAAPLAPLTFTLGTTTLGLAGGAAKALTPSVDTDVSVQRTSPRAFAVLGFTVPIGVARWAAVVVLVLALVTLAASAWISRWSRSDDPVDDILLRNSARILPVTRFTPGTTVIDVTDAAALHRVAEKFDSMVLHQQGPEGHTFAVQDVDATYRFVLPVEAGGRAPVALPSPGPVRLTHLRPVPPPHGRHAAPETLPMRRVAR